VSFNNFEVIHPLVHTITI